MAGKVDVGKTKQARGQMEFGSTDFWKPKAGNGEFEDNYVRVLPPHDSMDGRLFTAVSLHWMPDKTSFLCPRNMHGGNCPVCQKGFEVVKLQGKDQARKFWPSWSAYMNVAPLNKDGTLAGDGPKLWSASRDVTDILLEMLQDEECGDFTDLETGRNLRVKVKKIEEGGFTKRDFIINASPNQTPFGHPEFIENLIDPTQVNQLLGEQDMQRLVHLLVDGPGAANDPLALPQGNTSAPADEWDSNTNQPTEVVPAPETMSAPAVDEWGEPIEGAAPAAEKPKRGRRAAAATQESIEEQKARLRADLAE